MPQNIPMINIVTRIFFIFLIVITFLIFMRIFFLPVVGQVENYDVYLSYDEINLLRFNETITFYLVLFNLLFSYYAIYWLLNLNDKRGVIKKYYLITIGVLSFVPLSMCYIKEICILDIKEMTILFLFLFLFLYSILIKYAFEIKLVISMVFVLFLFIIVTINLEEFTVYASDDDDSKEGLIKRIISFIWSIFTSPKPKPKGGEVSSVSTSTTSVSLSESKTGKSISILGRAWNWVKSWFIKIDKVTPQSSSIPEGSVETSKSASPSSTSAPTSSTVHPQETISIPIEGPTEIKASKTEIRGAIKKLDLASFFGKPASQVKVVPTSEVEDPFSGLDINSKYLRDTEWVSQELDPRDLGLTNFSPFIPQTTAIKEKVEEFRVFHNIHAYLTLSAAHGEMLDGVKHILQLYVFVPKDRIHLYKIILSWYSSWDYIMRSKGLNEEKREAMAADILSKALSSAIKHGKGVINDDFLRVNLDFSVNLRYNAIHNAINSGYKLGPKTLQKLLGLNDNGIKLYKECIAKSDGRMRTGEINKYFFLLHSKFVLDSVTMPTDQVHKRSAARIATLLRIFNEDRRTLTVEEINVIDKLPLTLQHYISVKQKEYDLTVEDRDKFNQIILQDMFDETFEFKMGYFSDAEDQYSDEQSDEYHIFNQYVKDTSELSNILSALEKEK